MPRHRLPARSTHLQACLASTGHPPGASVPRPLFDGRVPFLLFRRAYCPASLLLSLPCHSTIPSFPPGSTKARARSASPAAEPARVAIVACCFTIAPSFGSSQVGVRTPLLEWTGRGVSFPDSALPRNQPRLGRIEARRSLDPIEILISSQDVPG